MNRARKNKVEYGAALQLLAEPAHIWKKKSFSVKKNTFESL